MAVPRVPDRMWFGVTVFSLLVEWGICPQTFSSRSQCWEVGLS